MAEGLGGVTAALQAAAGARPVSEAEAVRFLLQAQFSADEADIRMVREQGYAHWLGAQFAAPPGQLGCAWLTEAGYNKVTPKGEYFWPQFGDFMIWNQLLTAPDQMRKRCAFALSQFFVVSLDPIDGFWPPYMIGAYWDLLATNAFGNFRELLERVTLNAAMGMYLNTKGNLKEDAESGRQPDENYAREIMQLFSIGLYELNEDGTLRTDAAGAPIETYTQDDVTNLARVFTGYDHDYSHVRHQSVDWLNYPVPDPQFCLYPMSFDAQKHSQAEVRFLSAQIPARTPGPEALRIALDTLFAHPNVGPFFCKQMIQRLVTSNPSPAYVRRVSRFFADNGEGVRGDLKAVWAAILLDPEARRAPDPNNAFAGKVREPVARFVQWARTAGVRSETGAFEIHSLARGDTSLGQSPLRSRSVFNFYRPGYVPPHTAIAEAGKLAPEFQLVNESSIAGYVNFLQWAIRWGYNDVKPTYEAMLPMAHEPRVLVAWLNLRMAANQLSATTCARIEAAIADMGVTQDSDVERKMDLCAGACLLVLSSPEYLVQK